MLEQRIGRIYRLGQTERVDVLNLVSESGIESRIAALVAQKHAVFATLFDGTSDEVLFDSDQSLLAGVSKLTEPVEAAAATPSADADVDTDTEFEELIAKVIAASSVSGIPSNSKVATVGQERESTVVLEHQDGSSLLNALSQLSIERRMGGLRIETPPSLAAPLARLFEDLAASLKAAATDSRHSSRS